MRPNTIADLASCCSQLSKGSVALLARILNSDPAQRITLPEIMQDAWFRESLPAELDGLNDKVSIVTAPNR